MHFARAHAAVFLFCAIRGAAQAPADKGPEIASHDAPTTFTSKVNLVMVPVVVRDARGKAIGTLKKEDFQLFDKGKPQTIVRFSIEKSDGRTVALEAEAADPEADKNAPKSPAPVQASRFTAYVFDDMNTPFGDLARARQAAIRYLNESMNPVDRAAVFTTSGLTSLDFTEDREKLAETMNRIMPRSRKITQTRPCPDVEEYSADLIVNRNDPIALTAAARDAIACGLVDPTDPNAMQTARQLAQAAATQIVSMTEADTQVSLSMLKAIVQRMSAMPGQRNIVLVSGGFLVSLNFRQEETQVMDRAIRANVTISALDARGLWARPPGGDASGSGSALMDQYNQTGAQVQDEVLGELADATGGTFFHNNNDLKEGFQRTGASPEFMYILGFSPENLRYDGSYHSLKVTAKEVKGVTLQARRGYYAPNHAANPAEEAREEIRVALFSREEMLDIPVDLQTQFFKPSQTSAKLAVLARVDLKHLRFKKSEGRNRNTLSVVSAVFDRNGVLVSAMQKDVEMKLRDETFEARIAAGLALKTSFDVPPGTYVVRVVVRDSEGQTMAARNRVVEIP
jgi:VWFA-related protein